MAASESDGVSLRRSVRSTKGMLPVRFRDAESDSRSSVSEPRSSVSAVSNSSRKRRAELEAAVHIAQLEQQKLDQQKKIVELELAATLAEIDDESSSVARSEVSFSQESLSLSFQTCVAAAEVDESQHQVVGTDDVLSGASVEARVVDESSTCSSSPPVVLGDRVESQSRESEEKQRTCTRSELATRTGSDSSVQSKSNIDVPAAVVVSSSKSHESLDCTHRDLTVKGAFAPTCQDSASAFMPARTRAPTCHTYTPATLPVCTEGTKRRWQTETLGSASRRTGAEIQEWVDSVQPFPSTGIRHHHVKPLELPKFNGDQKVYIRWRQRFLRLVDDDTMASEDYKLARLREALEGGMAEELIVDILDGAGAYRAAMEELDLWYGSDDRELERQQQELMAIPRVTLERNHEKLQQLAIKLRNVLLNMRTSDIKPGRDLYIAVTQKLPRGMLTRFIESHDDSRVDVQALSQWLLQRVHTSRKVEARLGEPGQRSTTASSGTMDKRPPRHARSFVGTTQSALCLKCNGQHSLTSCQAFKVTSITSRWDLVKPSGLCINCLKDGHRAWSCSAAPCQKCQKKHHVMLHHSKDQENKSAPTSFRQRKETSGAGSSQPETTTCASFPGHSTILMLVPVVLVGEDTTIRCTAMLDSGSTTSYIREDVAKAIGLSGNLEHLA